MTRIIFIALALLLPSLALAGPPARAHVGGYIGTGPGGTATGDIDLGTGGYRLILDEGTAAAPSLTFIGDLDTGIFWSAANQLGVSAAGGSNFRFAATSNILDKLLNASTQYIYSSAGMLDLGGAVTSTHALDATVGSVGISGALEVDGDLFVDDRIAIKSSTFADGDATPDVSGGSMFVTPANTGPTVITDLDLPAAGQIVTICIGSATNPSTIADAGNFNLSAAWNPGIDDCITLYVQADNDYIELSRVNN